MRRVPRATAGAATAPPGGARAGVVERDAQSHSADPSAGKTPANEEKLRLSS